MARAVEGWRRQDPPAVPQLAVPITVPQHLFQQAYGERAVSDKTKAIADLSVIAFFYLLRVGEYTQDTTSKPSSKTRKRTVNFRVRDVGFFKNKKILPRNSPLHILLTADACTLKITNQKNGRMGQTIHHEAIAGEDCCPVKSLARRVHHILQHTAIGNTPISAVFPSGSKRILVTPTDMIRSLRGAAKALHLHNHGIDPDLIGVHSLRSGGAMAMKLQGVSDTTIMKMGRWRSLTFLMYIHEQIAHISHNLSTRMSRVMPFTNVAAIEGMEPS